MDKNSSLCLAAQLENLSAIRNFVWEKASGLGVDQAIISDLLVAADEAATNVIVHGYQGHQGTIEIEVSREVQSVEIHIRDHAPPFDPTAFPLPDLTQPLEKRSLGGLGIYLIRQYMDEITHSITPQGGNELIMTKKLTTRSKL